MAELTWSAKIQVHAHTIAPFSPQLIQTEFFNILRKLFMRIPFSFNTKTFDPFDAFAMAPIHCKIKNSKKTDEIQDLNIDECHAVAGGPQVRNESDA